MATLLDVQELVSWLKLKEATVRKWVSEDKIPYLRVGRRILFDRAAIVGWLRSTNPQVARWEAMAYVSQEAYNSHVR